MFPSKFLIATIIALTSIEKISSFASFLPSIRKSQTFLRYTVIGGIDDDEEPEKDPWAVGSSKSTSQQRSASPKADTVSHGPGDLSGYSDEYVEKEVDNLNVDAYDSTAGQVMPGFHLSALCGDD